MRSILADFAPCLPPEEIAAFAEGRLAGEDRARAMGHLARCASCREMLAGTLAVLEDLAADGGAAVESSAEAGDEASRPPERLAPVRDVHPAWRRGGWIPALAAAAVALVTSVLVWQSGRGVSPPSRSEWLAAQPAAETLVPHLWGGEVTRGGGVHHEIHRSSAEVGALLVDLEVALAAEDGTTAAELAYRLAAVLEEAGLLDREVSTLRTAAAAPEPGPAEELRRALAEIEPTLRERFAPFWIDLGSFAEQVRVSALAGDDALEAAAARRYLDELRRQDEEPLPAEVQALLGELAEPAAAAGRGAAADRLLRELTR
jgi:hypothetical protein